MDVKGRWDGERPSPHTGSGCNGRATAERVPSAPGPEPTDGLGPARTPRAVNSWPDGQLGKMKKSPRNCSLEARCSPRTLTTPPKSRLARGTPRRPRGLSGSPPRPARPAPTHLSPASGLFPRRRRVVAFRPSRHFPVRPACASRSPGGLNAQSQEEREKRRKDDTFRGQPRRRSEGAPGHRRPAAGQTDAWTPDVGACVNVIQGRTGGFQPPNLQRRATSYPCGAGGRERAAGQAGRATQRRPPRSGARARNLETAI